MISLNGVTTEAGSIGFIGGGTGDGNLYANVPTGFNYVWRVNGVATLQHLSGYLIPSVDLGLRLGGPSNRWLDVQANTATFAGTLTGTTATFNGGGVNGALKVTTNDSIIGGLFAGATKGVRIVPNAAFTAIEGVDNTGVGSYQPLTISGSVVNIAAPLSGTTATFSGTVMAPGAQIQMVSVETGAVATGTTVTPLDDTIPQITEGNEFMTLAITPKSATSTLVIDVIWVGASSATGTLVCALHQDAIANALAASVLVQTGADNMLTMTLCHKMTSGTTSATTFRVRVGLNGAGTITFNGRSAARQLGGVMASSIVIREVAP
jgi:hypothetical protein